MTSQFKYLAFAVLSSMLFASCSEDDSSVNTKQPLQIPSAYDSTGYAANVATEASVRSQLAALTSRMQIGRNMDSSLALSALQSLYNNTTLRTVTGASYQAKVDIALEELAKASGKNVRYAWENAQNTLNTDGGVVPTANGGKSGYLFDERMLEMEQVVEKGLFAAAMYNHAATLINSATVNEATIDKLVEIFGAKPTFRNGEYATADRDRFSAQYAARRSDSTNRNSLYALIKNNLITAKAAVKSGSTYNEERDKALSDFKLNWEKALAATVVNYCHSTLLGLNNLPLDDAKVSKAMHAYGEAVGFLSGWKAVPSAQRKITDAELDELLGLLRTPFNNTATAESYLFLSSSPTTAALVQLDGRNESGTGVIERLQQIYGFSNEEIESYRQNWVAVQNRR